MSRRKKSTDTPSAPPSPGEEFLEVFQQLENENLSMDDRRNILRQFFAQHGHEPPSDASLLALAEAPGGLTKLLQNWMRHSSISPNPTGQIAGGNASMSSFVMPLPSTPSEVLGSTKASGADALTASVQAVQPIRVDVRQLVAVTHLPEAVQAQWNIDREPL